MKKFSDKIFTTRRDRQSKIKIHAIFAKKRRRAPGANKNPPPKINRTKGGTPSCPAVLFYFL
ncbi:MAG: hypothetical protein J6X37_03860, partial [Treponema sp.]|nr:hypothetical protein [Treponema sp.]